MGPARLPGTRAQRGGLLPGQPQPLRDGDHCPPRPGHPSWTSSRQSLSAQILLLALFTPPMEVVREVRVLCHPPSWFLLAHQHKDRRFHFLQSPKK